MKKNTLLYAICLGNYQLTPSKINKLLYESDLTEVNTEGYNTLMAALTSNLYMELNLSSSHWNHLLHNSDLSQATPGGMTALMQYIYYRQEQRVNLTEEQKNYLFDNSNIHSLTTNKQVLLNLVFLTKENKELFDTTRMDYLVEQLKFGKDWVSQVPDWLSHKDIAQNYQAYLIDKEKRELEGKIPPPTSLTVSVHKI